MLLIMFRNEKNVEIRFSERETMALKFPVGNKDIEYKQYIITEWQRTNLENKFSFIKNFLGGEWRRLFRPVHSVLSNTTDDNPNSLQLIVAAFTTK